MPTGPSAGELSGLETEGDFGAQKVPRLAIGIVIPWEFELGPEMPHRMCAEFILQDGLEEMPPERAMTGLVTVAGEQRIRNRAGSDLLFRKQRIIRRTEFQAFGRIEAP